MVADREAELEAIRAQIRHKFPPDTIVDALGAGGKPADVVLGAAMLLVAEIAPALLDAIARAGGKDAPGERDKNLAFYGLHVLGGARDARAFPGLMRILHLPEERLHALLGDGLTETIKRVAIGTFDGDAQALFALMADETADEYARYEMFGVAAFLAFEGRLAVDDVVRFLVRFDDERLAPARHMAWCGWEDAIALLGLRALVPRVEAAWRDGRTPDGFSEPAYFASDLERAEQDDPERFGELHGLGYIEDIVEELSWITYPGTGGGADSAWDGGRPFVRQEPYINPLRDIGRNDPCPCGSGKKAKRCCLAS